MISIVGSEGREGDKPPRVVAEQVRDYLDNIDAFSGIKIPFSKWNSEGIS